MNKVKFGVFLVAMCFSALAFANDDEEEDKPIDKNEEEAVKDAPATTLDTSMTGNATAVGEALNKGCSEMNLAEKLFCYPVKWIVDATPCFSGKNTPQYTLCKQDAPSHLKVAGSSKDFTSYFQTNAEFKAVEVDNAELRKHLLPHIDKFKPGQAVHTWSKDLKLVMRLKRANKENVLYVMELLNAQGKVVGRPAYYFKGSKLYIQDLKRKPLTDVRTDSSPAYR